MDKIYEFWYTDCIHESAAACISLHRTKKGAEMAMEFHKNEKYKKWEDVIKWRKEHYGDDYEILPFTEFVEDQAWGVEERKVIE